MTSRHISQILGIWGTVLLLSLSSLSSYAHASVFLRSWHVYSPNAIAVGPNGWVYVSGADSLSSDYWGRVSVFDHSGVPVMTWTTYPAPRGIAVDRNGFVYVTSYTSDALLKYDAMGGPIGTPWNLDAQGISTWPWGVAVSPLGEVLIVNQHAASVERYTLDGQFLGRFGGYYPYLYGAQDIACETDGSMWVADTGNDRLQHLSASNGSVLLSIGQLAGPTGVALDVTGHVFVVNARNHEVREYAGGGELIETWGRRGTGEGEFESPTSIAIDGSRTAYVVDKGNSRIQVFAESAVPVRPNTWGAIKVQYRGKF